MAQWTETDQMYATITTETIQFALIDGWRAFHFVYNGLDLGYVEYSCDLFAVEVWDADTFDQSQLDQSLHCLPCVHEIHVALD